MTALFLTIFSIFTGTASLLGFVYIFFSHVQVSKFFKRLCIFFLILATFLSAYILFVPNTSIEANVAGKIAYYKIPSVEYENSNVMVQRGDISFSGFGPVSVEFSIPFLSKPHVEVINIHGYSQNKVPKIVEVTAHQIIFKRDSVGATIIPERLQNYRWIARGPSLSQESANK